jgi:hypothetical protein
LFFYSALTTLFFELGGVIETGWYEMLLRRVSSIPLTESEFIGSILEQCIGGLVQVSLTTLLHECSRLHHVFPLSLLTTDENCHDKVLYLTDGLAGPMHP